MGADFLSATRSFLRGMRSNPARVRVVFRSGHPKLDLLIAGSRPEVFAAWLVYLFDVGEAHGEILSDALGRAFGPYVAGDPDNTHTVDEWLSAAGEAGWIGTSGPPSPTLSQRAWHGLSYGGGKAPARPSYFMWAPGPAAAQARAFLQVVPEQPSIRAPRPAPPRLDWGFPYNSQPIPWSPLHFGVIDRRTGQFLSGSFDDPEEAREASRRLNRAARLAGVADVEE